MENLRVLPAHDAVCVSLVPALPLAGRLQRLSKGPQAVPESHVCARVGDRSIGLPWGFKGRCSRAVHPGRIGFPQFTCGECVAALWTGRDRTRIARTPPGALPLPPARPVRLFRRGRRAVSPGERVRRPPRRRPPSPPAGAPLGPSGPRRHDDEAHVPAEQPQAGPPPRVPAPHVDPSRPSRAPLPAATRAASACRPERRPMPIGRIRTRSTFSRPAPATDAGREAGALRVTYRLCPTSIRRRGPCVAFAISRAVGTAVVRNRVRQAPAGRLPPSSSPPPGTYLVTATPAAAGAALRRAAGRPRPRWPSAHRRRRRSRPS